MKYKERYIQYNGRVDRLIFDFEPKYEIVSTFLTIEIAAFEDWIKADFDMVLSGKAEYKRINGNVCGLLITPITTRIVDNLAEDGMGNWCEIDTKELRMLIDEWCDKYHEFRKEYHK